MIRKLSKAETWQRAGVEPSRWELRDPAGNLVAEVLELPNGEWRWNRVTTIREHGLPPATGIEPSRREAQRRAAAALA